jgi:hypothetical protein
MSFGYYEPGYIEEDYFEEDLSMAIDALPPAPNRSMEPAVFVETADTFLSRFPTFAAQLDTVARAMSANSTNSTSTTSNTIASSGSKTFTVQIGKSYVVGMTVRAASAADGTVWMQGDVTAYDAVTGELSITMNSSQGSGTIASWVLSLSSAAASSGSLTQDFSVKSLRHAIGASIASATTIDLSTVTGNLAHLTGNTTVTGATMIAGKDVWLIIDGTPQFTYHATNLKLNSGGANVTLAAGDIALFTYDGTTVRVAIFRANGKAIVETAPPAGAVVGSALIHFGSSAPTNYLVCPTTQTNVSRTTYATLFAAIGTTWGIGDGSTTFGLPWFAADYTMLQANSNVGSASTGTVKAHTHPLTVYGTTGSGTAPSSGGSPTGADTSNVTGSTGGTANLAAGSRVLICVKYQ